MVRNVRRYLDKIVCPKCKIVFDEVLICPKCNEFTIKTHSRANRRVCPHCCERIPNEEWKSFTLQASILVPPDLKEPSRKKADEELEAIAESMDMEPVFEEEEEESEDSEEGDGDE